jgi:hypothetical protein
MAWIESRTTGMNLPYLTIDKKGDFNFNVPTPE